MALQFHDSEPLVKGDRDFGFRNHTPCSFTLAEMVADPKESVVAAYVQMRIEEFEANGGEQKELARRGGLSPSNVSQVRAGKLGVGGKTLPKWAKAFGLSPVELTAKAYEWDRSARGVTTLPTRDVLMKGARSGQHEQAMGNALSMGISAVTVDLGNRVAEHMLCTSWDPADWMKLYITLHELDRGAPPSRQAVLQKQAEIRSKLGSKKKPVRKVRED